MTPPEAYDYALELSFMHEGYTQALTPENLRISWLAAALCGRLEICDRMAFSWLRCDAIPSFPPKEEEWRAPAGKLWISDAVGHPSVSGVHVMRSIQRELVNRKIATEGEKVYFYRYHTKRFGSFLARGG